MLANIHYLLGCTQFFTSTPEDHVYERRTWTIQQKQPATAYKAEENLDQEEDMEADEINPSTEAEKLCKVCPC